MHLRYSKTVTQLLSKCSLNTIFGRVGRYASEEVVLQLISSKCLPILLYAAEVCGLCNRDISFLDFVVNRFFNEIV
jgi:hypothetical protein